MTLRRQWVALSGLVAVLGVGLWAGVHYLGDAFYEVGVGRPAPGFNALDVSSSTGELKTLSDYRGKVVLLNLWATWCGPCKQEMPSIERLHQEFAPRGLAVVAVSVDNPGMDAQIREFVSNYALTFDVLYDQHELFRAAYRYAGVPETYLIDRNGIVRRRWLGADDWSSDANRQFVAQLLSEPEA